MISKHIRIWMLTLLAIISTQAVAQSLSRLEYWFDQRYGQKKSVSIGGDEEEVSLDISTSGLSDGMHWFYCRAVDTDGIYSGITASPFVKADPDSGNKLEYWFDNDYASHGTMDIDVASGTTELNTLLDLSDTGQFPVGFHQFNYQLIAADGQRGPVSTTYIMHLGNAEPSWVEYWFDEDQAHSRFAEGTEASEGGYKVVSQLDLSGLAPGVHRLYYRASSASNNYTSAISSTSIMVWGNNSKNTLEYWFDNDYANRDTLTIVAPADTSNIATQLDLHDIDRFPLGYHRVNMRLSSPDGTFGPVTSVYAMRVGDGEPSYLEYWFDEDQAHSRFAEGTEASEGGYKVVSQLDLSGLAPGVHRLYYRATSASNNYTSAISSTSIMVWGNNSKNTLEYWFDNDYANRDTLTIVAPADTSSIATQLDLHDIDRFPLGYHRVNMRLSSPDGTFGPVTSVYAMRVGGGEPSYLEYWIDDDIAHSKMAEGTEASDCDFKVVADLDLSDVAPGFHRLYYRASSLSNRNVGAISMAPIMVSGNSGNTIVEYWVDDDLNDVRTVATTQSGNSSVVDQNIDLGDVAPGFHRLHYRASSADNRIAGAVGMTPVMVKSMYNPDVEDLKVESYAVQIDGHQVAERQLVHKAGTVTIPDEIDMRRYDVGQHVVSISAKNSAGIWSPLALASVQNLQLAEPEITLAAQSEANGLVKIEYNTIPNDHSSAIFRVDADGRKSKIKSMKAAYPNAITYYDKPGVAGEYTYYIKSGYTDADGESQMVESNHVAVNVSKIFDDAAKLGSVVGYVTMEGQLFGTNQGGRELDIHFSDGEVVRTQNSRFHRSGIEIGTTLTVTIPEDDYYSYSSAEVVVAEHNDDIHLHATAKELVVDESVLQPSSADYDWVISSPFTFDEDLKWYMFYVRSCSDELWTGKFNAYAMEQDVYDILVSNGQDTYERVMAQAVKCDSYRVRDLSGEFAIHLSVSDLVAAIDTKYAVFFMSEDKNGKEKPVGCVDTSVSLPVSYDLKGVGTDEYRLETDLSYVAEKVVKWLASITVTNEEIAETAKAYLKANGIDYDEEINSVVEIVGKYNEAMSKGDMKGSMLTLNNLLSWTSGIELVSDNRQYAKYEYCVINSMIKSVEKEVKTAKKAKDYINYARDLYNLMHPSVLTKEDARTMYMKYGKKLMQLTTGNPFLLSLYSTYFECGEKMLNLIDAYAGKISDQMLGYKIMNKEIGLQIHIADRRWVNLLGGWVYADNNYSDVWGNSVIRQIKGEAYNKVNHKAELTFSVNPDNLKEKDGEYYYETKIINTKGACDSPATVTEFWVEIEFTNGQTVHVPLHLAGEVDAIKKIGNGYNVDGYSVILEKVDQFYYIDGQKPTVSKW